MIAYNAYDLCKAWQCVRRDECLHSLIRVSLGTLYM